MRLLANISINMKLILIQLVTAIVVIVICALTFVVMDYKALKENKVKSISSIAKVIGSNTISSLLFGDNGDAHETLTDLNVESDITNASIIDTTGSVFASYTKEGQNVMAFTNLPKAAMLSKVTYNNLFVYYKIYNKGEWLGTVCIKVDLSEIETQLFKKIRFALLIILIGAILAYLLAYFLQKYISNPIIELVNVMESVMESGNYSIRSRFKGKDEVAKLSIAFNKMIEKIEKHDQAMIETNSLLESRVRERTQELLEQNKKLVAAKAIAEQSKTVKEQFLASMSHEIRTPLNAILGFQELLKDTPLNPEQKEFVESIDFAGKNLLVIINDILDLSKIEAGKFVFEETSFNLGDIIRSVVELVDYRAKEKNIKVNVDIDKAFPEYLLGDSARLSQILLNLIGNAIKFTEKGNVGIKAELLEKSASEIKCKFIVSDTGIGIPQEKIRLIFERFTQGSSDTTRKYGGTGLGLTIVQHLIEMQGGKIDVISKIGAGSSFIFYLNFKTTSEKPSSEISSKEAPEEINNDFVYSVLLAEDIPLNQRLIKKIMHKWNYHLDVANNGAEAVQKLIRNNYDIILMDIQMPEVDGYTATKMIREMQDERKKNIPIIAITAHASNSEAERCINMGMNAYVSKPFKADHLKTVIHQLINKNIPKQNHPISDSTSGQRHLYNLDYLVEHADGDKEFIIEMIGLFLKDVPEALSKLKTAIDRKDYAGIKIFSHSMKGLFLTLGIQDTGQIIKEVERSAERQDPINEIVKRYREIEDKFDQVKEPLHAEIEELKK